ncbi:MAG: hypothetical protein GWN55_05725 [Phycisphaerae bacterium]|nr:hypothetical protein [Phycisphaerae bacterium]NIV00814.1 hypothetical protein [Phycisphaerae bacterium]NIX30055.1 hypothetical protein [Phycisphaerae bacterium]
MGVKFVFIEPSRLSKKPIFSMVGTLELKMIVPINLRLGSQTANMNTVTVVKTAIIRYRI